MIIDKNRVLKGKHSKPILVDVFYIKNEQPKPIIIFCHGYKGFKDWGAWDLMGQRFAKEGFCFIKFNFSHNGGTVNQPIDFPDLEAFGENTYTKELDDLETIIDWVFEVDFLKNELNKNQITVLGHSRGGGIVSIKAEEDNRIKNIISLAGVSDYKTRFPKDEDFKKWKEKGVFYVKNGRTHQEMPHFYQFFEDFNANENRLTIKRAVSNLSIPHLIIHGEADTSVSIKEAKLLNEWNPNSQFEIVKDANHVFGASHPWNENKLPKQLQEVVDLCVEFLN